ncbi:MAG: dihydrolipoyl dehydrogenase [Pseudomonadota bacterium]
MKIVIPDLGDFSDVDVIEVLVNVGDVVDVEQALVTLETDKATMDIPSPAAGTIEAVSVAVGDKVSSGTVIGELSGAADASQASQASETSAAVETTAPQPSSPPTEVAGNDRDYDVVVLGSGPGGYSAAFRAADLGLKTALIERHERLGGVCLNVGCIPSKALLHAAKVIEDAAAMADHGILFGQPKIDAPQLRDWKQSVVNRLTGGLAGMAKQRKVDVIHGTGTFRDAHTLDVERDDGSRQPVSFTHCIVAAGSESVRLPGAPDDPRVVSSTGALELAPLPESLLVVGGGIIGLEMACVYDALGVPVTIVELSNTLMPGADPDLVRPLSKRLTKRYKAIHLGVKVTAMRSVDAGIEVTFDGDKAPAATIFGRVLVAVGRTPNGRRINAEAAGIHVDERGFIPVDNRLRTNVEHIFAIGDIVGQPMLAHKATHEGHVAAEVIAGEKSVFDARVIPSVAYTDPEVAWVGVTETQAKADGLDIEVGKFPWAASGRSLANGRDEGLTKLIFDRQSHRLVGAGIVGTSAGDLISELALAIEMGADARDIALTIHPHPTLGETVGLAAEVYEGTVTDLYVPRKRAS